jgi:hypothetical protein
LDEEEGAEDESEGAEDEEEGAEEAGEEDGFLDLRGEDTLSRITAPMT